MSGIRSLKNALTVLMVLYVLALIGALIASAPMIEHVRPKSECLLFSSLIAPGKLSYGNYVTCSIVGYVQVIMAGGAFILFILCWSELRKRSGHAKAGEFENQSVPTVILWGHVIFLSLGLLLAVVTTAGYVSACENLRSSVSSSIRSKLNEDPFNTRGEEIETRYEDDYKFHRYTNKYGNAFGAKFYTISITCKSILTDPEIHQKLHDTHYEQPSRYFGYWYGTDLYAYDAQNEATKTNSLVEASLAGGWISALMWIAGCVLIFIQGCLLRKETEKSERISVHSAMMGSMGQNGSMVGSTFRRDGSLMSGSMRGSSFQRGGTGRGSDRSIKSTRRDVDDIALFMHHMGGSRPNLDQQPMTGYGRKELDDLAINQHILNNQPQHRQRPNLSQYSSMETGYVSDNAEIQYTQPDFSNFVPSARPVVPQPSSTHHYRDEVETEIF